MHQYLKAIGFENLKKREEIRHLLKRVEEDCNKMSSVSSAEEDFSMYERDFGRDIGIAVCGSMQNGQFEQEYYYPYFKGTGITSYADIIVERKMDQESYLGICEDAKIGISIIFHVLNAAEYIREKEEGNLPKHFTSVTLSGLALSGTILLPVIKNEETRQLQKEESRNRMMLLAAAREGNQAAIESLTLDDIDTYSQVSKRLDQEDVFSIVETYFMPYGLECTLFSILGEILKVSRISNRVTGEKLYVMTLDVNELQFDICVPEKEVTGEVKAGRRFKGNIWLQGKINF